MDAAATSAPLSPPSLKVSLFAEVNRVSDIGKEETKIFSSMRFDLCGGGDEEVVVGRTPAPAPGRSTDNARNNRPAAPLARFPR